MRTYRSDLPVEATTIKVKRLHPDAFLPVVSQAGDVAADLFYCDPNHVANERLGMSSTIPPGRRVVVSTGIAIQLTPGFRARFHSRSGLSAKHGIEVGAGLIDNSYRGELKVVLHNHSDRVFYFKHGDRIAQMCIERYEHPFFTEVDELDETSRSEGFGSSGR